MIRKIVVGVLFFSFGVLVLLISILRTAEIRYGISDSSNQTVTQVSDTKIPAIDYVLPFPGRILPDHPLWELKCLRDKVWSLVTTNKTRKAELLLLFADKRLGAAELLFIEGKNDIAYATLIKAEMYLMQSYNKTDLNTKAGIDTDEFLIKLSEAALKHLERIKIMQNTVPDTLKPEIIKIESEPFLVYEKTKQDLNEKGISPSVNPFISQ